jgi:hypothetical protein
MRKRLNDTPLRVTDSCAFTAKPARSNACLALMLTSAVTVSTFAARARASSRASSAAASP